MFVDEVTQIYRFPASYDNWVSDGLRIADGLSETLTRIWDAHTNGTFRKVFTVIITRPALRGSTP